jgi:hypothetical protein
VALTLAVEQELEAVGLVRLFTEHQAVWTTAATQTRTFIAVNFPDGSLIRRDDVAKAMVPILEVDETLRTYLDTEKIRGKHWVRDFADLIIDRTWDLLEDANDEA